MMDDKDWAGFKQKLKAKTEIDLDLYKEPQMKRRIGNLVTRAGMDSFCEYFDNAYTCAIHRYGDTILVISGLFEEIFPSNDVTLHSMTIVCI